METEPINIDSLDEFDLDSFAAVYRAYADYAKW